MLSAGNFKLDRVERKIVRLLQQDGRMTTAELARRTGVVEATIRRKLKRLLEEKLIAITVVSNPSLLGYGTSAYIGLDVERYRLEEVATELAKFPEVESVAITTGPNDLIIKVSVESTARLYAFLFDSLPSIDGIKDTESYLILKQFTFGVVRTVDAG